MSFVHLSVHSEYSLHDSLVRIKPLMKRSALAGAPAVAITDDSNLFCAIKAYKAAMSEGVKPILGAQIQVSSPRMQSSQMTLLCKDNDGYRALTQIISRGYEHAPRDALNRPIIPLDWFSGKKGLIALSGAREGEVGRLLLNSRAEMAAEAVAELKKLFGEDFYIELQRIGHPSDDRHVREAVDLAIKSSTPVVATNPVRFIESKEFASHEVRLSISQGISLKELRDKFDQPCTMHQFLKSPEEMMELFSDIPEAIENTLIIAAKCSVDLTLGQNFLPNFKVPNGLTEPDYLEHMAFEGLEKRLKYYFKDESLIEQNRQEYVDRLRYELNTIREMGFPGYFLIVADFIRWAKANDIAVGPGRGSGAGSLVAYSLGITDLNPIPYALLFERFLNPERVSMPDFDVDFCMDKRDRVIQYVADTYGHAAVSQIITFGTMAAKMVIKDVARALNHPYRFGDNISKMIPDRPGVTLHEAMAESTELKMLYETDNDVRTVMDHALSLEGITRQVGKHAGGVLIAPGALTDYTATYCEKDGSGLVSQFDKDDVETAGLVKFDFLGLRNLTIIDHAVKNINMRLAKDGENPIDILDIPLIDSAAYELLKRCETTAVFQLESAGMKNLIKRLQPDCFEDLIALVALFRPGPLQSGMVDDFIDRKHGRAEVTYPHPLLKPVLENTYGVIVYQEQVMQIAQILAGYTLGEADMLRRAMGKKKPEEMAKQRQIFIDGSVQNGIQAELAGSIFDLMEKFAAYGFNKSHSAAYALIAYQTLWLKAHYPADFMASVLSSDMDNTDKVVRFIHECRQMKLDILPPNANESNWLFTPVNGKIVYGLGAIKGLGHSVANQLVVERENGGAYKSLTDFLYRNQINKRVAEACINAGLFDFTEMDRAELTALFPLSLAAGKQLKKSEGQGMLFDMELPEPPKPDVPMMASDLRLLGERKVLGLYLTGHPYTKYKHALKDAMTSDLTGILANAEDQSIEKADKYYNVTVSGLITDIEIKSNSKGNYAFFKLDDGTARISCTTYDKSFHEYQSFIKEDNLVVLNARVRFNIKTESVSLTVNSIQLLSSYLDNQSGRVVIDLPEGANLFKEIARIRNLSTLLDEGALRLYMRQHGSDELVELPNTPISSNGPALNKIRELWGQNVHIEYVKQQIRTTPRKISVDITPAADIADLEAMKSSLRTELEQHLEAAMLAMKGSKEEGMSTEP